VIPYAYASRLKILPVKVAANEITVAVSDPFSSEWLKDLEAAVKVPVRRVLSNPLDIDRYLVEFYAISRSVKASGEQRAKLQPTGLRDLEQLTQLGRAGKLTAEDQHVAAIVDWLMQYAFDSRASDIHVEPRRDTGNVRFRIDGVLHDVYQVPALVTPAVTSRIKILSRMDVAGARRTVASRPARRRARKSSCACPRCPRHSARSWSCAYSTRTSWSRISRPLVFRSAKRTPGAA
jgi:general secretion pathway protein E